MWPYHRFDVISEHLWHATVEGAPSAAGSCLALTLLVLLAERIRAAEVSPSAMSLLVRVGSVHVPLPFAACAHATAGNGARRAPASAAAQLLAGVDLVTVSDSEDRPHGVVVLSSLVRLRGRTGWHVTEPTLIASDVGAS